MMEPFVSPPMISCSVRKAGCLRERETVLQAALILAKLPWGAQLSCHRRHYRPTAFTFLRAASGDGRLPVPLLSILGSSFAGIFLYRAATVPAHPQYNNGHVTVIFPSVAPNTPPFCTWLLPDSHRVRAPFPGSTQTTRTTHSTKSPWSRRLKFGGQVTVCSAARTSAS